MRWPRRSRAATSSWSGARLDLMNAVAKALSECGIVITETARGIRVAANGAR